MPALRNPRVPLLGALLGAVLLAFTGVLAYLVPVAHSKDATTLEGFKQLNRPRLTPLLDHVAHLADPGPYAVLGLALVLVALLRRRPRSALAILVLLVATGATTESLKHLLAHPRYSEWLGAGQIAAASWPSGHATASMTLALCAVLAAPPRLRPTAAAAGAAFAVAVSYSILALGWHFPSDVLGGLLVAGTWTLLAVAGLLAWERRLPAGRRAAPARMRPVDAIPPVLLAGGVCAGGLAIALARPRAVASFAVDRPGFVAAAAAIAVLATLLAGAVARVVRR